MSAAIRHVRKLSTTASSSAISISRAKSRLRSEYDPDKALEIYSSVSKDYASPVSSRYAQDLTVRRLLKSHRFSDIENLLESHKNDPKILKFYTFCMQVAGLHWWVVDELALVDDNSQWVGMGEVLLSYWSICQFLH